MGPKNVNFQETGPIWLKFEEALSCYGDIKKYVQFFLFFIYFLQLILWSTLLVLYSYELSKSYLNKQVCEFVKNLSNIWRWKTV